MCLATCHFQVTWGCMVTCALPCVITIIHIHDFHVSYTWHPQGQWSGMDDMCETTCQHKRHHGHGWLTCVSPCLYEGAYICMVSMCPPHGTSKVHGLAWVPCVPTHVISRDYGHTWLLCVLTDDTSNKLGWPCSSPCNDPRWNVHNSFISCPFWIF